MVMTSKDDHLMSRQKGELIPSSQCFQSPNINLHPPACRHSLLWERIIQGRVYTGLLNRKFQFTEKNSISVCKCHLLKMGGTPFSEGFHKKVSDIHLKTLRPAITLSSVHIFKQPWYRRQKYRLNVYETIQSFDIWRSSQYF